MFKILFVVAFLALPACGTSIDIKHYGDRHENINYIPEAQTYCCV